MFYKFLSVNIVFLLIFGGRIVSLGLLLITLDFPGYSKVLIYGTGVVGFLDHLSVSKQVYLVKSCDH